MPFQIGIRGIHPQSGAEVIPMTKAEVKELTEMQEHYEDGTNCIYPYPEHDQSECEEIDGIWGGVCPRCGAEMGFE